MTPQRRNELQHQLAAEGLTVIMTKDYNGILLQLARLAEFNRLVRAYADIDHTGETDRMLGMITTCQDIPADARIMERVDIPGILAEVNRTLQELCDQDARICPDRIFSAASAFCEILTRR